MITGCNKNLCRLEAAGITTLAGDLQYWYGDLSQGTGKHRQNDPGCGPADV